MIGHGCCLLCILEKLLKMLLLIFYLLYFGGSSAQGIFSVDSLLCHMLQSSVKVLKRTHVFNPVTKVVRFLALRLELCRQLRLLCHMLTGPGAVEAGVCVCVCVCVFITAGPIIKLCAGGQ